MRCNCYVTLIVNNVYETCHQKVFLFPIVSWHLWGVENLKGGEWGGSQLCLRDVDFFVWVGKGGGRLRKGLCDILILEFCKFIFSIFFMQSFFPISIYFLSFYLFLFSNLLDQFENVKWPKLKMVSGMRDPFLPQCVSTIFIF